MWLHLPHKIQIDDSRAVNPLEPARIETLFEVFHRLAQDERIVSGLDAHVVAGGINPLDSIDVDAEDLPLILDVDHLLVAVRGGR